MKTKFTITILILLAISLNSYAQKDVSGKSAEAIKEIKKTNKKINKYFTSAFGYAVFPSIGKGGLGVGAATGTELYIREVPLLEIAKCLNLQLVFRPEGNRILK